MRSKISLIASEVFFIEFEHTRAFSASNLAVSSVSVAFLAFSFIVFAISSIEADVSWTDVACWLVPSDTWSAVTSSLEEFSDIFSITKLIAPITSTILSRIWLVEMRRLLISSLPVAFISADKSPSVIAFTAEFAFRSFVLIPAVSSSPKINAAKVEAIPTTNVTYSDWV